MGRARMTLGGAVAAATLAVAATTAVAAPNDVLLVSRAGASGPGGNSASTAPAVGRDGHSVAFLSRATNLTADVVPGSAPEAFVRDVGTGTNVLASRADGAAGAAANAAVSDVSVSDDGRYVAFDTAATNLVAGATAPGLPRAYVRDTVADTTTLVAPATAGVVRPDISGDGAWVAFASNAHLAGDQTAVQKVYVRDEAKAPGDSTAFDLVSRPEGSATPLSSDQPAISRDGRFVAFRGQGGGATGEPPEAWLMDRQTRTLTRASVTDAGDPAGKTADEPDVTPDGRYVVFRSAAPNLGGDGANTRIYERDMVQGTTMLVSRANGISGAPAKGPGGSDLPQVSDDGRLVLFRSAADNLSKADNDAGDNGYVRDTVLGTITVVHAVPGQPPAAGAMSGIGFSGDGRFAVYDTSAQILPGQEANSGNADVFRRELAAPAAGPRVSATNVTVTEGGAGQTTPASFTIKLSVKTARTVTVDWHTVDGLARAGQDYIAAGGTATIPAGQSQTTVTIGVLGDAVPEGTEGFRLVLSNPGNATLGQAGKATILDDDGA